MVSWSYTLGGDLSAALFKLPLWSSPNLGGAAVAPNHLSPFIKYCMSKGRQFGACRLQYNKQPPCSIPLWFPASATPVHFKERLQGAGMLHAVPFVDKRKGEQGLLLLSPLVCGGGWACAHRGSIWGTQAAQGHAPLQKISQCLICQQASCCCTTVAVKMVDQWSMSIRHTPLDRDIIPTDMANLYRWKFTWWRAQS